MSSRPAGADEPDTPDAPGTAAAVAALGANPLLDEPVDESPPTMNRRADLLGSLALVGVGVLVLAVAFSYPPPSVVFDAVGPMGFPEVIGAFLVVGGAVQSLRTFRAIRRSGVWAPAEGAEDEPEHPSSRWRALLVMAGSAVYLALLEPVGFEIATTVAIVLALWALDYRTWVWRVIVAVSFTVFAFVLFGTVLGVPLPNGVLQDLLLDLGLVSY